jgi:hypothetical protein
MPRTVTLTVHTDPGHARSVLTGSVCLVATFYPVLVDDAADDKPITVLMRLSDESMLTINNGPMLPDETFDRIKRAMLQLMQDPELLQVEIGDHGTLDRLEA